MKLRNKKTGDVTKIDHISIPYRHNDSPCSSWITSIAQLNEEWEDYAPQEPLIKDEKIRKAVRLWAEINATIQVVYVTDSDSCRLADMNDGRHSIDFIGWIPTLKDCGEYTITELCGDEEE